MQVTATAITPLSKEAAIQAARAKGTRWLQGKTDFAGLISLYKAGHIICLSDKVVSDALIIDVDLPPRTPEKERSKMTEAQRAADDRKYEEALKAHANTIKNLGAPEYLAEVARQIGADNFVCLPSASRHPLKRKIFFKIHFNRQIENNKDLEGERLRKLFERITGIAADPSLDEYTRLTFGCRMGNEAPLNISKWEPACRIKKEEPQKAPHSEDASSKKQTFAPANNTEVFQRVPLNMGAYNHKYGKAERHLPRLDWMIYRYGPHGEHSMNYIPVGARHRTSIRVIASIVINARIQNEATMAPLSGTFVPFTLKDCLGTLKSIIHTQFVDGAAFWETEGFQLRTTLAAEWAASINMDAEEAYMRICARMGLKENCRYVPRDEESARIWRFHRDDLANCAAYEEVKNLCGKYANGDKKIMDALLRRCRKDPAIAKPTVGRGHFANHIDYLENCPKTADGCYLVSRTQYNKKLFRDFCREHGYAIRKA